MRLAVIFRTSGNCLCYFHGVLNSYLYDRLSDVFLQEDFKQGEKEKWVHDLPPGEIYQSDPGQKAADLMC